MVTVPLTFKKIVEKNVQGAKEKLSPFALRHNHALPTMRGVNDQSNVSVTSGSFIFTILGIIVFLELSDVIVVPATAFDVSLS